MATYDLEATIPIARPPIHPLLLPFSASCLVGALLTDITYWGTAEMMWADFSAWLVSAGVILFWIATIIGVVELFLGRFEAGPRTWAYVIGNLAVLVLATLNMFVHTRDAWTSVVPWGLTLSALTSIALLVTTLIGWSAIYRREAIVAHRVLEA